MFDLCMTIVACFDCCLFAAGLLALWRLLTVLDRGLLQLQQHALTMFDHFAKQV
jgi:hypothetical protein